MTGINDNESLTTRYKNTLILWCGSLKEPVKIDDPAPPWISSPRYSIFLALTTIRACYRARDVLAPDATRQQLSTDMHVAIFADYGGGYSWITRAGTYEASLAPLPRPGA